MLTTDGLQKPGARVSHSKDPFRYRRKIGCTKVLFDLDKLCSRAIEAFFSNNILLV